MPLWGQHEPVCPYPACTTAPENTLSDIVSAAGPLIDSRRIAGSPTGTTIVRTPPHAASEAVSDRQTCSHDNSVALFELDERFKHSLDAVRMIFFEALLIDERKIVFCFALQSIYVLTPLP